MSSAILYVAIVAIWACVLIPRWLHRGATADIPETENLSSERVVPSPQHSPSPDVESETAPVLAGQSAPAGLADEPEPVGAPRSPESRPSSPRPASARPSPDRTSSARTSSARTEARQRMLAARRRLLLMLLGLQVAAVALTVLSLAAAWVLIPPTVMLAGYLLLLREAAHADAERTARTASNQASRTAEAERSRTRAQARAPERRTATPPAPAAPTPEPVPEPADEDYSDLGGGRDYTPGLAGKYDTSDPDVIDMYKYKRAVGD